MPQGDRSSAEESRPGVYHVEHGTPQVKAFLGHLGPRRDGWDDRDEMPILVLSEILGGGGTLSRLRARLRARERLVYRTGAMLSMGESRPGELRVFFETEGNAVPRVLEVVLQELRALQTERVPAVELELARESLLAAATLLFESAEKTAGRFAEDEMLGRPHAYWSSYGERIRMVTAADVQRVARAYLEPEKLLGLLVGRWSDISSGESALRKLLGPVTHLPARDPLTLEPVEAQAAKTIQAP